MLTSNNIGIVADDLTGANDTALQFHIRGANTQILLNPEILPENRLSTQVWAMPTETRNLPPSEAYERVKSTVELLKDKLGIEFFYKKIDSTLRGNIAAETLAMLEVLDWDAAVLLPAFPQEGRITVGGYHLFSADDIAFFKFLFEPLINFVFTLTPFGDVQNAFYTLMSTPLKLASANVFGLFFRPSGGSGKPAAQTGRSRRNPRYGRALRTGAVHFRFRTRRMNSSPCRKPSEPFGASFSE